MTKTDREDAETQAFREQCRRQMARPLEARMKYGWCRVNRPVLDTPGTRIFASTREYLLELFRLEYESRRPESPP